MKSSRGKRAAALGAGFTVVVVIASGAAFHRTLLEQWYVHRLSSDDPQVRLIAIAGLGRFGADRSFPGLMHALAGETAPREHVEAALESALARASPRAQSAVMEKLVELTSSGRPLEGSFLRRVGVHFPAGFAIFARELESSALCAEILVDAWPSSRTELERGFRGKSQEALHAIWGGLPSQQFLRVSVDLEKLHEVMGWQAREGATPEARGIALYYALTHRIGFDGPDAPPKQALDLLHWSLANEQSSLVRHAAVRMAGWLGDIPGNLHLPGLLQSTDDPELLCELIQAREVWSSGPPPGIAGLKLWDGFVRQWARPHGGLMTPWSAEELGRLERILATTKHPRVRDAASSALSAQLGGLVPWRGPDEPSLRVHEWGVFRDGDRAGAPPEAPAGLPDFVHLSQVTASQLWPGRLDEYGIVYKPILFFESPSPICVSVGVSFYLGRPWMFYPEATDYFFVRGGTSAPFPKDRLNLTAAWFTDDPGKAAAELSRRYSAAPWLVPDSKANRAERSTPESSGLGLHWRGLRVGYPAELEGDPPAVAEGSWWRTLREVPATPVALRGNTERFLFYDGSVRLPSPVLAAWEDEARRAILLKSCHQDAIPDAWVWAGTMYDSPPITVLPAVLVVHKTSGREARGRVLESIRLEAGPVSVPLESLELDAGALRRALQAALEKEGLAEPEARSLVAVWDREFFENDGLRILTVIPEWFYASFLPIDIRPRPGQIVRTGVVWRECADLGVGEAAFGEDSRDARWRVEAMKVHRRPADFQERPLPELEARVVSIAPDGCLTRELGGGTIHALSEDGSKVLLSACPAISEEIPRLCLADAAAGTLLALEARTNGGEEVTRAGGMSGDGRRVLFSRESPRRWRLHVLDLERRLVLDHDPVAHSPGPMAMSSDGKRIAYSTGVSIRMVDLESRTEHELVVGPFHARNLVLSADGWKVAYSRHGGGADVTLLDFAAERSLNVSRSQADDWEVQVSAAADRIVFLSERDRDWEVYLAEPASRSLRNLSRSRGTELFPSISANGRRVAFAHEGQIQVLDVETGEVQSIAQPGEAQDVRLSADGRRLSFNRTEIGKTQGFVVKLDG